MLAAVLGLAVQVVVLVGTQWALQLLEQPQHNVHEAVGFGLDASQCVVVLGVPEQPAGREGSALCPRPMPQCLHPTHRVGTPRAFRAR